VFTNYQAYQYRNTSALKANQSLIMEIEKETPGLVVENLVVKNLDDLSKPILQTYDYTFDNAAEKIGDDIYISPLSFLSKLNNPFVQESREYPIDFICPISDKYTVGIDVPDGYEIDFLPENSALEFNNGAINFSYLVQKANNKIQLIVEYNINKPFITKDDYQNFKNFYQMMISKKSEKIIIKKI